MMKGRERKQQHDDAKGIQRNEYIKAKMQITLSKTERIAV
jgi:hypothetical protein